MLALKGVSAVCLFCQIGKLLRSSDNIGVRLASVSVSKAACDRSVPRRWLCKSLNTRDHLLYSLTAQAGALKYSVPRLGRRLKNSADIHAVCLADLCITNGAHKNVRIVAIVYV